MLKRPSRGEKRLQENLAVAPLCLLLSPQAEFTVSGPYGSRYPLPLRPHFFAPGPQADPLAIVPPRSHRHLPRDGGTARSSALSWMLAVLAQAGRQGVFA